MFALGGTYISLKVLLSVWLDNSTICEPIKSVLKCLTSGGCQTKVSVCDSH